MMDFTTLIISDLHVGGGPADPGDDHIYQGRQLVRFLDDQAATPDGQAGHLELIINGDFLEFAQTNTAAFHLVSDQYWCTAAESFEKLNTIIAGHPDIFDAIRRFQNSGNIVTIAAGNHDVDLAWPAVQDRIREAAGSKVRFEMGQKWISRYNGLLQIGHGHMYDDANRFKHWDSPIQRFSDGVERLEMCPGTMFMVKFVNHLEAKYPFANNLLPISKLFSVLMREDKAGLASVAWLFVKLLASSSMKDLGATATQDIEKRLLSRARNNAEFHATVDQALLAHANATVLQGWRTQPVTSVALQAAMLALLGSLDNETWQVLFDARQGGTLGSNAPGVTLNALRKAAFEDGKAKLRLVARDWAAETKARVVVMGHTHQPDQAKLENGVLYFNPGCWTRYLELEPDQDINLADLEDESRYPYQLNYIRVEPPNAEGEMTANKICFDSSTP